MTNELLPLHCYKNVIMDIDGTLIDSNDAHAMSFIDAFKANDIYNIDFEDIRKMIGMSGKSILCHMLDEETFSTKGEKIEEDRTRIFEEQYMDRLTPFPGVIPLLEFMKSQGMRIALSSSSPESIVKSFVERLEIRNLIEGYTSSDDTLQGKPNPLAIEVCCEKFGFAPHETVLIGDSPYDIIAAYEFSIPTIALLTGGYSREELSKTGAVAVYQNLDEIYRPAFYSGQ